MKNLRTPLLAALMLAGTALAPTGLAKSVTLMERIPLAPAPKSMTPAGDMIPFPAAISVHGLDRANPGHQGTFETFAELFAVLAKVPGDFGGAAAYRIQFEQTDEIAHAEGYRLLSDATGIKVRYRTAAGQFYGAQTVYQLLAYAYYGTDFLQFSITPAEKDAAEKRFVPLLTINDEPAYPVRSFMADLGRAPYSVALLKRVIRIMGQLKLNTLHLHLYDDQLCGFRFARLPLGRENPFSLSADDLKEVVRFARVHHVSVMPELESWGHVASLVYHYPELSGGEGMYAGASFAIGEKTYALLEKIYDEIVPCLENETAVHVGLDEATWAVLPGEENKGHTPTNMVGRIHDILMRVGERHGKKITMHLWADHGGRALPKEIEQKVVIEPWRYLGADAPSIATNLQKYGGAGKTPLMMGAGANSTAYQGNYEATRVWCQEGLKYPNILGVTLCMWETNDVAGRLTTLYGGAAFAWSPEAPKRGKDDLLGERMRQIFDRHMRSWQIIFPVADPAAINLDRGPEVKTGRYCWPPLFNKVVAPTVDFIAPRRK